MSDEERRRHERAATTGDTAARVRVLRERIRDGTLLPSRLELAAYAGDVAAFEALEPARRAAVREQEWRAHDLPGQEGDASQAFAVFERAGVEAERRAAAAAVGRAFAVFETTPQLSPARGALGACFAREEPPSSAEVAAALHAVRQAVRSATMVPELIETLMAAELLERALRKEVSFASVFVAASRAVGLPACGTAVAVKLLAWAEKTDAPLAAALGSTEARRDLRPELRPGAWTWGLERWGAIPLVRAAMVAARIRSPSVPLTAAESWLADPSRARPVEEARSLREVRYDQTPLDPIIQGSTSACGLPIPVAGPALQVVDRALNVVKPDALRAALEEEILRFALADTAPLFRFEDVEVLEELGDGPLGWAFRGRLAASGEEVRLVGIGAPLPEAEVRAIVEPLRALDHPNLARVARLHLTGTGAERGVALVFARASGVELGAWAHALPDAEKLALLGQIAAGLEHGHAKGVVHCTLEPTSIRVQEGVARIVDLGVDRLRFLDLERHPNDGPVFRMHGFFAPEVLQHGWAVATPATDVYVLGALAAWLYAGRVPFEGTTIVEVARKIVQDAPPPVPLHGAVIARALAKDPAERFPTIAAFREALLDE